jgi:voltage-gated potassium channel
MIPVIRRSPSLLLLISLIVLLLVTPQAEGRAFSAYVVTLLFALVLFSALRATAGSGWRRVLATGLGVLWLCLSVWNTTAANRGAELASQIVFISFASFIITLLIRRIVSADRVDFEVVCASPSVYLLIAIIWAVSYHVIESLVPGSFVTTKGAAQVDLAGFLYFSLTTITTLGYGDITPVRPTAGIWTTLEAVTGVFFMAILVARLVTLYRR